jgi:hypothetical protein
MPNRTHSVRMVGFLRIPLLALVQSLAGCGSGSGSEGPPVTVRDSAGIVITENHLTEALEMCLITPQPQVVIGVTDGAEEYQLYRVFDATRLSNGELAVVNQGSSEIRIYDREGAFQRAFGGQGEGPGEFRNVFQIWSLPGDTLWVGDYRPWRFLVFGPEGEWVRTIQPEPMYPNSPSEMGLLDDGRAILGQQVRNRRSPGFHLDWLHLVVHNQEGVLTDSLGVFPHGRWGKTVEDPNSPWLYPFFEPFTRVAVTGDRFAISTTEDPEIRVYDPEGELVRLVRWTSEDRAVRATDIEAEKRRLANNYADLDPATRERMVEPLIHSDRPAADRFPTLSSLQFGTDGLLWVKEYPRPNNPDAGHWITFDTAGRLTGQCDIPQSLTIFEFGRDYLLGEETDDLGVERVVLYGLNWAPPMQAKIP